MSKENHPMYSSEAPILYPSPEKEARILMRKADFDRLKRLLVNIRPEPKFLRTTYAICFGVAGTALFSIYPIHKIPQKSPWLLPIYICSMGFALLLAIILLCVDKNLTKSKTIDIKLIQEDMEEIEEGFKEEEHLKQMEFDELRELERQLKEI